MKFVVLAVAIGLGLAQQPAKPPVSATPSKTTVPHAAAPARKADSSTQPQPAPTTAATDAQPAITPSTERATLDTRLTWFVEALAAVAVLQFITLLWQGFVIRRMLGGVSSHAQQMECQSRILDGLLKTTTDQLAVLKDTASAASASAEAAKEHVALMASKERARLRVELQPFYLNYHAPSPASFTIQHEGSTDAFVLNSRAAIYVSDSRDPDPSVGNGKPLPIPNVISAKNPLVVAQDVLHPFTEEEIDSIRQLKSFVHFTGFIRYKDVFDAEHETRFNRVWSITTMSNLNSEPFTYWEHCGAADENKET
jgi:hypothetical protein